ncbi:MAG: hypothetical protein M1821_005996 [Bathelium mastoideum]|nr:MAG: hypothetical protein M1821_005996 [Bathelium mastoideum]
MATLRNSLHPNSSSTAIILPSESDPLTVTHSQLSAEVTSFQKKLARLGISPQTAISIALPNSYEFVVAFLAVSWQRAIAAPLNPAYKQAEFEFYIEDLHSVLALVPQGAYQQDSPVVRAARAHHVAIAECYRDGTSVVLDLKEPGPLRHHAPTQLAHPEPSDTALVLHTSGTTGRPKAVPLTHGNLTTTMANVQRTYALSPTDRTYLVMPLFHVHGLLAALLAPLAAHSSIILPTRFSASAFWPDCLAHGATWYTAVPTIHQILLRQGIPARRPPLRFVRSCSSPLPPTVLKQLEQAVGAPVLEAYAMTEGAHQLTSNLLPGPDGKGKRIPGSVGMGQGVEVRILGATGEEVARRMQGEIGVRGANVTGGYLNNPEANKTAFTAGGWFRTGDQGWMDEEGYVYITGRIKELINKGGEKISPVEVDNVMSQQPQVAEAVAFAMEDELYGQNVGVAVVLKEGQKVGEEELKEWMRNRVANFKIPKKIFFTDVMPKTATGKVQRRMVAEAMTKKEQAKAKL